MSEIVERTIKEFSSNLDELFRDVETWATEEGLKTKRSLVTIEEEASGAYQVEQLEVMSDGQGKLAAFVPVGAWIIGANCRLDVIGTHDSFVLVNLNKGGPSITTRVTVGDHAESSTRFFYQGIDEAGWYWIEKRHSKRGIRFSKELFLNVLSEVSGYEPR